MEAQGLINQFHLLMDRGRSKAQYAYLRSTINSEEEAHKFVDMFAEKTNTLWIHQTGKAVSDRYNFYLTWFCNRSWRKRDTAPGDECNAKIDVYVRKTEPSSARYDEYLHYDPPLPCIIEIAGQHNHPLEGLDYKIFKGIKDQVKRDFFKYFHMGLSVTEAKNKYALRFRHKRLTSSKRTPTLRQVQRLYNQWKGVEKWPTLKEGDQIVSQPKPVTFKEILDAVPKREILYSSRHLQTEIDDTLADNKDIKFPLVFVSVGSIAALPSNSAPLLYKLKHGIAGELVSDLVRPRIYSICIDSAAPVVVLKNKLQTSSQVSKNLPIPVSDEILGIPMPVDEPCLPVESTPIVTLNIPVKLEPLNDGYEDQPSQAYTEKMEDTSMMPIITRTFSCGGTDITEEIDVKPNISFGNSIEETSIKTNSCNKADPFTGNSFFPLVFTLKGSIYEASSSRSLAYVLKQGSNGVQATEVVIPQIASVQINSLNEAAFQFKDASMLKAEGPLSISVQTERLEENSNNCLNKKVYDKDIIPVIINKSSCSDLFPVITDKIISWSKKPREDLVVSPVVAPKLGPLVMKKLLQRKKVSKVAEAKKVETELKSSTVTDVDTNDEDYTFLMSLLPELKRLPPEEKSSVKRRMKDIFVTSHFTTNRYQFEKKSTNIYRDCGVLPISGGWKF